jgi:hypothetical protein
MPPRGKAPGLKRGRVLKDGTALWYWMAKQVVRNPMGYPDLCIPLPRDADDETLAELCEEHTARLFAHLDGIKAGAATIEDEDQRRNALLITAYDGTVGGACKVYRVHTQSPYNEVAANTRKTYGDSLKVIEGTVSARLFRNCTVMDVKRWYKGWRQPATPDGNERIDRAHNAVAQLRSVLHFCFALGPKFDACGELEKRLVEGKVRFERRGAREQEMTYQLAYAFIRKSLQMGEGGVIPADRGLYMAIGTAAQFELALRQGDIIGKWRTSVPGTPHAEYDGDGEMWSGPFRWENIPGWRFRLKTSKTKGATGFLLSDYPLLFPLLERVPHGERAGAIVKGEHGLPVRERSYRKWWRQIARAAGLPDEVWSMDARAGAITEADDAGVDFKKLQDFATHTDATSTERYRRRRERGNREVAKARAELRKAGGAGDKNGGSN